MQPLLFAALAAAAGILAAVAGPAAWAPLAHAGVAAALALVALAALAVAGRRGLAGGLGLAACFAAGYARSAYVVRHPAPPSALEQRLPALQAGIRQLVWITGYLRDDPEATVGSEGAGLRFDVEAVGVAATLDRDPVWPVSGGVRMYLYGDSSGLAHLHAGDGIAASAHLRAVSGYHDPGVADVTAALRREDIQFTGTVPVAGWRPWPVVAGPRAAAVRARVWSWLTRRLDVVAPPAREPRWNGVLRGMLLGDLDRIDPATRATFQIDGVYHLLVVAGLHIGVLAGLLVRLLRTLRAPRLWAEALALLTLGGYAYVIAGRTPTLRALLMLGLYFLARAWYRDRQALNAVGFAALVLLAWRPLDLFTPGLQMSVGAALLLAGVALPAMARGSARLRRATFRLDDAGFDEAFSPRLAQWRLDLRLLATRLGWLWRPLGWRGLPWALRSALAVVDVALISLVLQMGFAGFNAVYFHRANPWSVAANAVLVPAAALLIPAAWGAMAVSGLPLGARVAPAVIGAGGAWLLRAAAAMARWPGAAWRVPSPPLWFLDLFGLVLAVWIAVWAWPGQARGRWIAAVTGVTAAMALLLAWCPFPARLPPGLAVTVLDVGQGDAILVSFPDGRTLVVDGGPASARWDSGEQIVAPFLWWLGLHRVDAVLLTHGHNDHLGGLGAVVRDFHPAEVWVTPTLPREWPMVDFLRQVAGSGARLRRCAAGDVFRVGNVRLEVLLPPPAYRSGEIASNDDSMAIQLTYGGESALLTGDTEAGGEDWMLAHHLVTPSAFLKVGHHGSNTSSTPAFLAAVQPRAAVISVGRDNLYGHPSPDVVARLQDSGIRVFRTDRDGAVQSRMDGSSLAIYLFPRWPVE